jgi:hypothetical protein
MIYQFAGNEIYVDRCMQMNYNAMDFIILHTNFGKICIDQALGDRSTG